MVGGYPRVSFASLSKLAALEQPIGGID